MSSVRSVRKIRWLARAWSLLTALVTIFIIAAPDPYAVRPPTTGELVGLAFLHIGTVIGLLLAWQWELWGSLASLTSFLLGVLVFGVFLGDWMGLDVLVIRFAFWMTPAFLFLLCWENCRSRQSRPASLVSKGM